MFFQKLLRNGRIASLALGWFFLLSSVLFAQSTATVERTRPGGAQKLMFADAQKLLIGEAEGNLSQRAGNYSRTRLRSGQVLELFYPIRYYPARGGQSAKQANVAGYGLLFESEIAYQDSHRPRHILEELLPDGQTFVTRVPELVASLERRLRVGNRRLDFSRASLKRIDTYLASYRRSHTTADTDPTLFQELTAYYGEVLRREFGGDWRIRSENIAQKRAQQAPNVSFDIDGVRRELKPWSSVLDVLYNEDHRTLTLAASYEADIRSARQ